MEAVATLQREQPDLEQVAGDRDRWEEHLGGGVRRCPSWPGGREQGAEDDAVISCLAKWLDGHWESPLLTLQVGKIKRAIDPPCGNPMRVATAVCRARGGESMAGLSSEGR